MHFTRSRGHVITEPGKQHRAPKSRTQIAHMGAHPGGAVRRQSLAPNEGGSRTAAVASDHDAELQLFRGQSA